MISGTLGYVLGISGQFKKVPMALKESQEDFKGISYDYMAISGIFSDTSSGLRNTL